MDNEYEVVIRSDNSEDVCIACECFGDDDRWKYYGCPSDLEHTCDIGDVL